MERNREGAAVGEEQEEDRRGNETETSLLFGSYSSLPVSSPLQR